MQTIGILGCGVVGASWAQVFARAGHEVVLFDAQPGAAHEAANKVAALPLSERAPGSVSLAESLEALISQCDYIQESAPERLEIKRELYMKIDNQLVDGKILASSTSGFPASAFTENLKNRSRCLVAHPINPPHLIPLVEVVPAPWTDPEVLSAVQTLMSDVGQSPIMLSREINGFVVNRLQSAMLGEAFRLVEDGCCSVEDVDKAVRDGLGLRWFFMGPFETIDLNARNGVAEYCRNLGLMYFDLAREQADPREWSDGLVKSIEGQRREVLPEGQLEERKRWRDTFLEQIVAAKTKLMNEA